MPLGSLTADHEMVNGASTLAPAAGERGVGADGDPAAARPVMAMIIETVNNSLARERVFTT
jgi:hypothetical protein